MATCDFAIQFGKRIKALRESVGYSQEELAEILGYRGKSSISKIENGLSEPPASKLFTFASVLNTNVAYLMGWDDSLRKLTQEEFELITMFRNATEQGKALAIGNLQASQQDTVSADVS